MSKIVGVKYVGGKPLKEDNILGSGASWVPGQVINFNAQAAAKLALYKDVWQIVDVDHSAETKVIGEVKENKRKHEPQTFADVNTMNKEQLQEFARVSLLRQLPEDMELDALRNEVKNLLTLNFLDDQDEVSRLTEEGTYAIALEVTEAEYQAYLHGVVALRLVPVEKDESQEEAKTDEGDPESNDKSGEVNAEAEAQAETQVEAETKQPEATDNEPLDVVLGKLDAKELRQMCKETNIPYSNTMTKEMLIAKILAKAGDK